jgi:hypothetical protein
LRAECLSAQARGLDGDPGGGAGDTGSTVGSTDDASGVTSVDAASDVVLFADYFRVADDTSRIAHCIACECRGFIDSGQTSTSIGKKRCRFRHRLVSL